MMLYVWAVEADWLVVAHGKDDFSHYNVSIVAINQICPEMHVNEILVPHNRHHKVSLLMKFHQNTQNYIKY